MFLLFPCEIIDLINWKKYYIKYFFYIFNLHDINNSRSENRNYKELSLLIISSQKLKSFNTTFALRTLSLQVTHMTA
jgi:hypothetical protein